MAINYLSAYRRGTNELIFSTSFTATSAFYYRAYFTCNGESAFAPSSSGKYLSANNTGYFYSTSTGNSANLGSSYSYFTGLNSGTEYYCYVNMYYSKNSSGEYSQGGASESGYFWTLPEAPYTSSNTRSETEIVLNLAMPYGAGYSSFTVYGSSNGSSYQNITSYTTQDRLKITIYPNDVGKRWYRIYTVNGNGDVSTDYLEVSIEALYVIYYLTVNYDANGGTGAPSPTYSETKNENKKGYHTLSYTEPTREGYLFIGWATSKTATAKEYKPGETVEFTHGEKGYSITLYAVWAKLYYVTFTFDANGGIGAPSAISKSDTDEYINVTFPTVRPTRKDYSFIGWCEKKDGSSTIYQPGYSSDWYTGSYTFYAIWRKNSGGVYICNSNNTYTYNHYNCYICTNSASNTWVQATPFINTDGKTTWSRCT